MRRKKTKNSPRRSAFSLHISLPGRLLTATPGMIAIGCLLPVSGWWFMQMSVIPANPGPAASNASMQAVQAIVLLQFLSVSLFVPQVTANSQPGSSHRCALFGLAVPVAAFVLPAWPFLTMLSLGSGLSARDFATAEAGVLVVGLAVALLSRGLRYFEFGVEVNRLLRISPGLVAAISVWMLRRELWSWIGL